MVPSDQTHEGDPQRHSHGVPVDLPPSMVEIIAGAPRALPVSQRIQHGNEESRMEAFQRDLDEALGNVYDLAVFHRQVGLGSDVGLRPWVFRDRRVSGRRYRGTYEGDPDTPQEPYPSAPHCADIDQER
jgi:hypothetical protein